EENSRYLDSVSISIHGFENTHEKITGVMGSYKKSMKAIRNLLDSGVNTGICYTGTKDNISEIESFGKYVLDKYDIFYFGVNRFVPQGRGSKKRHELEPSIEEFNEIIETVGKIKKNYPKREIKLNDSFPRCLVKNNELKDVVEFCTAGVTFANINEYGDLKLCSGSSYSIGNVLNESLEDIWQNSEVLKDYRKLDWLDRRCKECEEFGKCLSGCKSTRPTEKLYCTDILLEENYNGGNHETQNK
ncbi:SPASM domain-containing protein, partial [Candidatus Peregrinibacteria bacterium]|nr:SPASM domain-containing protein [Candidatus Peregrinibacteria bacterium]